MKRRGRLARWTVAAVSVIVGGTTALPVLSATGGGQLPAFDGSWGSMPAQALAAYQRTDGWCDGLRWELVAAIGEIESGHGSANGASVDESGEASPWIFGPPLDGSDGTARIPVAPWLGWWGLPGPVGAGSRTDAVPGPDVRPVGRRRRRRRRREPPRPR